MDILLIFLLIFSFTPVLLWGGDNWKKTAIGQIPFVIGAWIVFYQYITVGIGSGQMYLWGNFYCKSDIWSYRFYHHFIRNA
ncbi:hypothetical protein JCM21714_911 [Gracilibacillus boraciitolerans JCM 21714]|uniref:Uncharacterized protein n=1 Tax=Gracilibacillus boraciitolerans JCM 21714 TaxID=1298598 RepID=W4VEY9_9BACI|nr:spore morphogenesis/germination protein YwcE [Gracilibacillus boraciitolerans]GAE91940.1 hypothetical protein JCM21714_911 [Gracilibacillus boraciitolerans JCM 21714]